MKNPKILKVPYNFVPLNKKVVSPYWIDHISQDVPFDDAQSGTIEVTLTAKSPIFVKRGMGKEEAKAYYEWSKTIKEKDQPDGLPDKPKEKKITKPYLEWDETDRDDLKRGKQIKPFEFEQDAEGNYIIPGSSLRGMVRSVLEVLSFGQMVGRVSERRYALRELAGTMKEQYMQHFKPDAQPPVHGGWLRYDSSSGKYLLTDCGVPGRISHKEIQRRTRIPIADYFFIDKPTNRIGKYDQKKDSEKSAYRKYQMLGEDFSDEFKDFAFDYPDVMREVYRFVEDQEEIDVIHEGKIVLTGQPSPRSYDRDRRSRQIRQTKSGHDKYKGKHLEFIFWRGTTEIEVEEQVVENFKFAYFDDDRGKQSEDYKWRIKQLEDGESIPVFFKRGDRNGNPYVKHFGLSYLYKLPYDYSVRQSIENYQGEKNATKKDLADAIFGYADTDKNSANKDFLRGRVQFSHAKILGEINPANEVEVILGEPRASFFPTYLRQKVRPDGTVERYQTFMDQNGVISGRKRYPVLSNGETRQTKSKDNEGKRLSEKVFVRFRPLPKETVFTFSVGYHNLRPVEVGALLSALTFHGNNGHLHQIGMAKALGYGSIQLDIEHLPGDFSKRLCDFEAYMNAELGNKNSEYVMEPQIVELLALTKPVERSTVPVLDDRLPYNIIQDARRTDDEDKRAFKEVKNQSEALPLHTAMTEFDKSEINKWCDEKSLNEMRVWLERDRKYFRPLADRITKYRTDCITEVKSNLRKELKKKYIMLKETLDNVLQQERAARTKKKANEASLKLDIDPTDRNAFDQLYKEVEKFISIKFPNKRSLLPADEAASVRVLLLKIVKATASKKTLEKDFTKKRKREPQVARWIGQEAARELFNEFKNL